MTSFSSSRDVKMIPNKRVVNETAFDISIRGNIRNIVFPRI